MSLVLLLTLLLNGSGLNAMDIVKVSPLRFPEQVAGITQDVVVTVEDENAAVYNIFKGEPKSTFTLQIEQERVDLEGDGTIRVDTFKVSGPTTFDGSGNAYNIRVGATAHIDSSVGSGEYYGSGTLLVIQD